MENTGAVIFGDYVYKTERELLDGNDQSTIAHELFHHWFGDLVTCESWANLPLNEYVGKDLVKYLIGNSSTLNFLSPRLPGVFVDNPESGFVNGSLWTLKVELFFYISVPILFYIFKKRILLGIIFALAITTIYKFFCIQFGSFLELKFGNAIYKAIFDPYTNPLANMTFFLCGSLFYYLRDLV
jgi:hypothetical protein